MTCFVVIFYRADQARHAVTVLAETTCAAVASVLRADRDIIDAYVVEGSRTG